MKLYSPGFVAILAVLFTGIAINVENSGNPVDSFSEAKERVVEAVVEGYENGEPITQDVYKERFND